MPPVASVNTKVDLAFIPQHNEIRKLQTAVLHLSHHLHEA